MRSDERGDRHEDTRDAEQPARRPRGLIDGARYQHWLDEQIAQATAEGQFDNLRGQGKPLPKAGSLEDLDDMWLGHHILKEAGFLPDWLQLRKEIFEERPAVAAALDAYRERRRSADPANPSEAEALRRLAERYVALAREINKKIDEHNLQRPSAVPELVRFMEDAIQRERGRGGGS